MHIAHWKIAGLISAALTLSVAANLLGFQQARRGGAMATSSIAQREALTTGPGSAPLSVPAPVAATAPAGAPRDAALVPSVSAERASEAAAASVETIRGIQRELNSRGYAAGTPDGVPGLVTRAAIMAYEYDFGLPLTAAPSEALLSRIVLGSSAPQATAARLGDALAPEAEALVRSVKQQLAALGYQPGKVDGGLTAQLARTIREFEIDQKLSESGRIGGPLVGRLTRLQGQSAPAPAPATSHAVPTAAPKAGASASATSATQAPAKAAAAKGSSSRH